MLKVRLNTNNKMIAKETKAVLELDIQPQPTEETCGPTCLHAVYNYYGEKISLSTVISEVKQLASGGTLGVLLGTHALEHGFDVTIYTYNLDIYDPTWFHANVSIPDKLREQLKYKKGKKFKFASEAYLKFLEIGGQIKFKELTPALITNFIEEGIPVISGLSVTYLYQSAREIGEKNLYDDVKGEPAGHFVIVNGYDKETRSVYIADPYKPNPMIDGHFYKVKTHRLTNAILLGIVTYDANLLVIRPKK